MDEGWTKDEERDQGLGMGNLWLYPLAYAT